MSKSKRLLAGSHATKKGDPSGYGADCMAGAFAGRAFLKQMIDDGAYYMLIAKVREVMESGKIGGFEVGFFGEIARATTGGRAVLLSEYYAFNHGRDPGLTDAAPSA